MNNAVDTRSGPSDLLAVLYGVLFRPRATFAHSDWARALGAAVGVQLLVALVTGLSIAGANPFSLMLAFMSLFGLQVLYWGLSAAFAFVFARGWGAKGDFAPLVAAWGVGSAPALLSAPLLVLRGSGPFGLAVAGLGSVALLVWIAWLWVLAVRSVAGLDGAKALAVVALSQFLLVAAPLAAFFLAGLSLVSMLG